MLEDQTAYAMNVISARLDSLRVPKAKYKKFWGYWDVTRDCVLVKLELTVGGATARIPSAAIADLANTHIGAKYATDAATVTGNRAKYVVNMKGGDGAVSYRVALMFSADRLNRRQIYAYDQSFNFRLLRTDTYR
jgi:hypothetical protein